MSDLISRQAAIEYFMTNTNWHDEDGYEIHDAEDKRALLKSYFAGIPSAQPEQVEPCSVSLIEKREQVEGWYYRKIFCCAKCGMKIRTETWGEKRCFGKSTILKDNSMPRYCPNCGAKMEESDG